jgi:hypothetical protein
MAASSATTQELLSILWNPKVDYHVCNSPPPVSNLSEFIQVYTTIFILSTHLPPLLPCGLFLLVFPTRIYMKNAVFWDVMLCGSCKNRRFGGT